MKILIFCVFFVDLMATSLELKTLCRAPVIANGKARLKPRGRILKYTCNVGYSLYGDRFSYCIHGKWDSSPPKCVRPGCRKVTVPNNGFFFSSHLNAVLQFFCKSSYELRGPTTTYCNGTKWSANLPNCLPTNSTPQLSCSFEDTDICGWTHDLNHDFEWKRMQFRTPSGAIGTGPSYDHTLGEGKGGYYMYIESSSRNEGDTAKLISPVYDKTDNNTCFQFFYHMYGTTIGSLRVYLKLTNESWNLNPEKAFFNERGNKGNRWIGFTKMFNSIPKDYQIVIEGVRGNGYVSDIAIDDVRIIQNCTMEDLEDDVSTTTESEISSSTDFLPDDLYSCENRCFSSGILMGKHRKCSCDENCYDRNDCCPDYVDFCIIHESSSIYVVRTTSTERTPSTPSPTTEAIQTTEKTTTTSNTSTLRTTTSEKTTEILETTPFYHFVFTLHIIPTTETTTTTTTTTTTSTTIKETTTKQQEEEYGTNENEEPTNGLKIETDYEDSKDMSNNVPQIPNDMVPIEDVAIMTKNYNEKIIISKKENKSHSAIYFSLCGVVFILCISTIIVLVRRKKLISRSRFSHSDSASDVRFLTSDELLDLNLDY